jgi:undecaprenyl-diphosphatase
MKKRGFLLIIGIIVLIAISFQFDSEIVRAISLLRNNALNEFFMGITFVSSEVIIFFGLTSLFLWKEHKRKWIIPLWATLALSAIIGFLLKLSVQRMRPFQLGIVTTPLAMQASYTLWNFSFPSFQAMLAFCAIPILSKEFSKIKYVWIAFAVLIAFSRVYFGMHFLSDVIAGGLIGYLLGAVIVKEESENKIGEKIYNRIFGK